MSLENIDNRMKWLRSQIDARSDRINPHTKERDYLRSAEQRRKFQLQLNQLEESRNYQIVANERMHAESFAAQTRNAEIQRAHDAEQQAIRDRAEQIRIERAAQKLANSGADISNIKAATR